jgi:hypothetical protein
MTLAEKTNDARTTLHKLQLAMTVQSARVLGQADYAFRQGQEASSKILVEAITKIREALSDHALAFDAIPAELDADSDRTNPGTPLPMPPTVVAHCREEGQG